jgi:hypothetical protein
MRLAFDGVDRSVEVPDDPEFLIALRAAAVDWPFASTDKDDEPAAVIRKVGGRFEILMPEGDTIEGSAVSAACSTVVDVLRAFVDENPALLCLHAASVELAGRLVVFPSRFRAGKSTLVAFLASAGHRVFGDDVLSLTEDDQSGVAAGLAPRLRIPLPANAPIELREFVSKHASAADERYLYLRLPNNLFARRAATAPLGAVVLLDRRADGPTQLFRASRAAALQTLIVQNFARSESAEDLLARLHRLMDRLPRFTLRYNDIGDARALLENAFAAWPPATGDLEEADPSTVASSSDEDFEDAGPPAIFVPADVKLKQSRSVRLREVDGAVFLTDAEGFGIHHLNPLGASLWQLMAEPLRQTEAVEILVGAFPDAERARIVKDVGTLFSALVAEGFAVPSEPSIDCKGWTSSA